MKTVILIISSILLYGCSQAQTQEAEGTYTNSSKETATAKLKLQNDTIKEVELDETTNDTTKKTLKDAYHMKAASSLGKEWYEQVQYLEQYIQTNGVEKIQIDDEGKAQNEDVKTGCTIRIDGFLKAIENAKQNIESQK